jgi:hypothetical protein
VRCIGVVVALVGFMAAQVGYPVVMSPKADSSTAATGKVRPCGCVVKDDCEQCCCTRTEASPKASCCQPPASKRPVESGRDLASQPSVHVEWVIGSLMQHCRGVETSWVVTGAVLPPADYVCVPVDDRLLEHLSCSDDLALPCSSAPVDPPPRFLPV